ncbi:MAG: GlcG/HbpS family heme-binding protein [Acidimicrobiales bacterium]
MSDISLDIARTIMAGALGYAETAGLAPLAVAVLDGGGHLKAFERADGSSNLRFEVAFGKANGALGLGVGSRALMARAEQQPAFIAAVNGAFGGRLIPVPGGVLVRNGDGALIGAVGVSGDTSDNDEAAAVAGIEAAGFSAETG